MAGWIVWVDDDNGPSGIIACGGQAVTIKNPLPVSFVQRIGDGCEAFRFDQKLQKRVGRLREKDAGSGVGDELEAVGIGFARTCREDQLFWGDLAGEFFRIVSADCLASLNAPRCRGCVGEGADRQVGLGEIQFGKCGIGDREIDEWQACQSPLSDCCGEAIGRSAPGVAMGVGWQWLVHRLLGPYPIEQGVAEKWPFQRHSRAEVAQLLLLGVAPSLDEEIDRSD